MMRSAAFSSTTVRSSRAGRASACPALLDLRNLGRGSRWPSPRQDEWPGRQAPRQHHELSLAHRQAGSPFTASVSSPLSRSATLAARHLRSRRSTSTSLASGRAASSSATVPEKRSGSRPSSPICRQRVAPARCSGECRGHPPAAPLPGFHEAAPPAGQTLLFTCTRSAGNQPYRLAGDLQVEARQHDLAAPLLLDRGDVDLVGTASAPSSQSPAPPVWATFGSSIA